MSTQPDSTPQAPSEAPDKGVGCDALLASDGHIYEINQGYSGIYIMHRDGTVTGSPLPSELQFWQQAQAYRTKLKQIVEVIEAHEIESLSCDRDGNEYCDCLRRSAKDANLLLANK